MRPQRFCAAAKATASVASLVTSASKATHSPPPCLTIDTVSSAEPRSRSTAMTFAPSCANRSTVARPLPIPSPGLWPAPMMMAVFPSRRIAASLFSQSLGRRPPALKTRAWACAALCFILP